MQIEQVKQLRAKLKATYEADQAAIDRVLTLLGNQNTPVETNGHSEPLENSTVEKRVVEVIEGLPAQFTLSDVLGKMDATINRASVSSVLFRLKESNKLTLIRAGQGRRAAIYGKP